MGVQPIKYPKIRERGLMLSSLNHAQVGWNCTQHVLLSSSISNLKNSQSRTKCIVPFQLSHHTKSYSSTVHTSTRHIQHFHRHIHKPRLISRYEVGLFQVQKKAAARDAQFFSSTMYGGSMWYHKLCANVEWSRSVCDVAPVVLCECRLELNCLWRGGWWPRVGSGVDE